MILVENPNGPDMDGYAVWHCQSCGVNSEQLFTTYLAVQVDALRHRSLHHETRVAIRSIDDPRVSATPDVDALFISLHREGYDTNRIADLFGVTTFAVHRRLVRLGLIEPTIPKTKAAA